MSAIHLWLRLAQTGSGNREEALNEITLQTIDRIANQVVVEHGTQPAGELYQSLRAGASNDGVTDLDVLLAGQRQPAATGAAGYEL